MPWSADHDLEMDSCAANIVENQASPNPPPFFCAFPHLRSRQTHYFVTSSKDGTIKFWDGDTFDHVLTLEGHFAPVWGLAVATDGDFVVTASQVLRVGCRARVRARMRLCTLKVCRCMYISVWPNAASIHSRVATLLPSLWASSGPVDSDVAANGRAAFPGGGAGAPPRLHVRAAGPTTGTSAPVAAVCV